MTTAVKTLQLKTLSDGTAHYSFKTTLDGVDYQVDLDWNSRDTRWYLGLRTAEGELLCSNVKVVTNWPFLRYFHHREGMPAGELMATTLTADTTPPGLYDLGVDRRCTLIYFPPGSIE